MKNIRTASYEFRIIALLSATLAVALCGWSQTTPAANKTATTKPVTTTAATHKPATTKPVTTTTATHTPGTTHPVTTTAATHKPATVHPGTTKPIATKAGTTKPAPPLTSLHPANKGLTPGKEISKGGGQVGMGLVEGTKDFAVGTGTAVGNLAHGKGQTAGKSFTKGATGAGKDLTNSGKGTQEVGKGVAGEFKKK